MLQIDATAHLLNIPAVSDILLSSTPISIVQPLTKEGTYVVQLQTHSVVDFIVGKLDMVFVRCIPLLENNLPPICTRLGGNEFLPSAL